MHSFDHKLSKILTLDYKDIWINTYLLLHFLVIFRSTGWNMTVRPLSDALVKKAEKEINEDPRRVESDIAAINEWLNKQSHLKSVRPCKLQYFYFKFSAAVSCFD